MNLQDLSKKNKKINLYQTFNAMRVFLNLYCENHQADDIAMLLGGLHLANNTEDWQENPRTWDPPAWEDWIDGVNKTLYDLNIQKNPKEILYDEWMAFMCMKNYLQLFYNQFSYSDIKNVLILVESVQQSTSNIVWNMWLQSIQHSVNNTYKLDGWY